MNTSKSKLLVAAAAAPLLMAPMTAHAGWWCETQCAAAYMADQFSCASMKDILLAGCAFDFPNATQEQRAECLANAGDAYDTCMAIAASDASACGASCANC